MSSLFARSADSRERSKMFFSAMVSLLPRQGMCESPAKTARTQSLRTESDLLARSAIQLDVWVSRASEELKSRPTLDGLLHCLHGVLYENA